MFIPCVCLPEVIANRMSRGKAGDYPYLLKYIKNPLKPRAAVLSNYPGHKEQSIGGLGTLQIGIETIDMSRGWSANNRSRGKRLQQRISPIESRSVTGIITELPGVIQTSGKETACTSGRDSA